MHLPSCPTAVHLLHLTFGCEDVLLLLGLTAENTYTGAAVLMNLGLDMQMTLPVGVLGAAR
jgi:hypothetical protein